MKQRTRHFLIAAAIVIPAACSRSDSGTASQGVKTDPIAPGSTIDSIIPIAESLRRFREGLPVVTELGNAAPSRDSLVGTILGALERGDTTALAAMLVTRAEYAHLYFPTSVYASKPYELAPEIAWMLSAESSEKGRSRLVQRLGGLTLSSVGYRCGEPTAEGANRLWRECTVTFRESATSSVATRRLFGSIIEHGGRFKLLSFANDF